MKNNNKNYKIHVKVGDTVQIITGKYKKQVGTIIKIFPKTSKLLIKDLNLKTKHLKASEEDKKGKIIYKEAPIHSSNVMLYSNKNKISSRYKILLESNKKKIRVLKKTQETI